MADKVLPAHRSELGHSFLNALWIAGFLAALQIAAVVFAIARRGPTPELPAVSTVSPLRVPEDLELIPGTGESAVGGLAPAPEAVGISPQHSGTSVQRLPAPDLSEISDPVSEIKDPLLARMVDSGLEDRRRGNLNGALDAFLDVHRNLPDHPRILCEIAGTYGEMGKTGLAAKYWRQVEEMGAIAAGPYFTVASKVLRGEDPTIPEVEEGKFLKLGKLVLRKAPQRDDGEWASLLIPIVGRSGKSLSGKDMDLRVYFYDLINGQIPGQTTATISYEFPSQPYDWKGNRTETVEVIYHQPVFTVEQKRNLGERVYFGYVIELYYQNQLQDSVVSSDELRSLRFPASKPVEEPPPPRGPDTSLFPINR